MIAAELDEPWLVWSIEHAAWWRPNGSGYTRSLLEAGRYSYIEAMGCCLDIRLIHGSPREVPIPESVAHDMGAFVLIDQIGFGDEQ